MGLLNSTSSIYWKGNWGPERKCVFILVTHSYLVAKSKLENGLLTPNPVLLYDHVLLPLSPTICPTLLQWQARLYPLPTTKLCRVTIQMAFSVYTEKLKDCSLKKKKNSLSLYFKDTHTCTHKDLGLHDFVGIAFWLHVPRQDGQKDQDPHVIRCRNFQVNTLSLKPLFIDTHSPLVSDHKNLLSSTTYF